MRTVRVEVTASDILIGMPKGCYTCPVACALRRALGRNVAVLGVMAQADSPHGPLISFPQGVREWIRRFDNCESVEPFAFEVVVPA